jgi:hypothetical protein
MSKRFEYERFDMRGIGNEGAIVATDSEGDWVKAQDALDREAVLQARIRTLEVQLGAARAAAVVNEGEEAMQRAAAELPDDWQLRVCLERGAGWIDLYGPDGEQVKEYEDDPDARMTQRIGDAIEFACRVEKERGTR